MSSSKFALFVDLENCGAKVDTLLSVLEKVKIRGDILLGKVYGYTDQYSDLKEVLLSNTFTEVRHQPEKQRRYPAGDRRAGGGFHQPPDRQLLHRLR